MLEDASPQTTDDNRSEIRPIGSSLLPSQGKAGHLRRSVPIRKSIQWLPIVAALSLLPACAPELNPADARATLAVQPLARLLALMRKGDLDALNEFPVKDSPVSNPGVPGPVRVYDPFALRELKDAIARSPKVLESLAQLTIEPDPPFVEEGRTFETGQIVNGQPFLWYTGSLIFKLTLPGTPVAQYRVSYFIDGRKVTYSAGNGLNDLRGMLNNYTQYIKSSPTRSNSSGAPSAAPPAGPSGSNPSGAGTPPPASSPTAPSTPAAANPGSQPTLPASTVPAPWWPTINAGQAWDVIVGRYGWRVALTQRVDQAGASSIVGAATGTNGGASAAIAAFAIVPSSGAVFLALQNDAFSIRCEFKAAQSSGSKLGGTATLRREGSNVDEAFGPCSASLAR